MVPLLFNARRAPTKKVGGNERLNFPPLKLEKNERIVLSVQSSYSIVSRSDPTSSGQTGIIAQLSFLTIPVTVQQAETESRFSP
jgi:hypothetical protein